MNDFMKILLSLSVSGTLLLLLILGLKPLYKNKFFHIPAVDFIKKAVGLHGLVFCFCYRSHIFILSSEYLYTHKMLR